MSSDKVSSKASPTAAKKGEGNLRPTAVRKRAAARLATVQLGYEIEMTAEIFLKPYLSFSRIMLTILPASSK
ncbi:MAG: hypothetical protein HON95_05870 [Alphaproteobacteria bacterium]|nr:hypothetical protein [Alphaproteobacteria bacterium]